jgi:hypothetical protein
MPSGQLSEAQKEAAEILGQTLTREERSRVQQQLYGDELRRKAAGYALASMIERDLRQNDVGEDLIQRGLRALRQHKMGWAATGLEYALKPFALIGSALTDKNTLIGEALVSLEGHFPQLMRAMGVTGGLLDAERGVSPVRLVNDLSVAIMRHYGFPEDDPESRAIVTKWVADQLMKDPAVSKLVSDYYTRMIPMLTPEQIESDPNIDPELKAYLVSTPAYQQTQRLRWWHVPVINTTRMIANALGKTEEQLLESHPYLTGASDMASALSSTLNAALMKAAQGIPALKQIGAMQLLRLAARTELPLLRALLAGGGLTLMTGIPEAAVASWFAWSMAQGSLEDIKRFRQAKKEGNEALAKYYLTRGVLGGAISAAAVSHAVRMGRAGYEQFREAIRPAPPPPRTRRITAVGPGEEVRALPSPPGALPPGPIQPPETPPLAVPGEPIVTPPRYTLREERALPPGERPLVPIALQPPEPPGLPPEPLALSPPGSVRALPRGPIVGYPPPGVVGGAEPLGPWEVAAKEPAGPIVGLAAQGALLNRFVYEWNAIARSPEGQAAGLRTLTLNDDPVTSIVLRLPEALQIAATDPALARMINDARSGSSRALYFLRSYYDGVVRDLEELHRRMAGEPPERIAQAAIAEATRELRPMLRAYAARAAETAPVAPSAVPERPAVLTPEERQRIVTQETLRNLAERLEQALEAPVSALASDGVYRETPQGPEPVTSPKISQEQIGHYAALAQQLTGKPPTAEQVRAAFAGDIAGLSDRAREILTAIGLSGQVDPTKTLLAELLASDEMWVNYASALGLEGDLASILWGKARITPAEELMGSILGRREISEAIQNGDFQRAYDLLMREGRPEIAFATRMAMMNNALRNLFGPDAPPSTEFEVPEATSPPGARPPIGETRPEEVNNFGNELLRRYTTGELAALRMEENALDRILDRFADRLEDYGRRASWADTRARIQSYVNQLRIAAELARRQRETDTAYLEGRRADGPSGPSLPPPDANTAKESALEIADEVTRDALNPDKTPEEHQQSKQDLDLMHDLIRVTTASSEQGEAKQAELYPMGNPIQLFSGDAAILITPQRKIHVRYAIASVDDLVGSHHPGTFAENRNYPTGIQDRAYHLNAPLQEETQRIAQNIEPHFLFSKHPTGEHGPPVILPDGIVLGGNKRFMALWRAYHILHSDEALRKMALDFGREIGLSDEQLAEAERIPRPVVVRVVVEPDLTVRDVRSIGTELNRNFTAALAPYERAVALGKMMKMTTVQGIAKILAAYPDATLAELLRDVEGVRMLNLLVEDGVIAESEKSRLLDPRTERLTEEGRDLIRQAFIGSFLDDPYLLARAPASVLDRLERIADSMVLLRTSDPFWNIGPYLYEAVRQVTLAREKGISIEEQVLPKTGLLFGGEQLSKQTIYLALWFGRRPTEFAAAFSEYARLATIYDPAQMVLPGIEREDPVTVFNRTFVEPILAKEGKGKSYPSLVTPDEWQQPSSLTDDQAQQNQAREIVQTVPTPDLVPEWGLEQFLAHLESVLGPTLRPEDRAALRTVIATRAKALGLDPDGWVRNRIQKVVHDPEQSADADRIIVEVLDDGRTLVQAFRSASLWDVLRALGQIFARDLTPDELERMAGVFGPEAVAEGRLTTWGLRMFTDNFLRYLLTRAAPTQELLDAFVQLRSATKDAWQGMREHADGFPNLSSTQVEFFDRLLQVPPPDAQPPDRVDTDMPISVLGTISPQLPPEMEYELTLRRLTNEAVKDLYTLAKIAEVVGAEMPSAVRDPIYREAQRRKIAPRLGDPSRLLQMSPAAADPQYMELLRKEAENILTRTSYSPRDLEVLTEAFTLRVLPRLLATPQRLADDPLPYKAAEGLREHYLVRQLRESMGDRIIEENGRPYLLLEGDQKIPLQTLVELYPLVRDHLLEQGQVALIVDPPLVRAFRLSPPEELMEDFREARIKEIQQQATGEADAAIQEILTQAAISRWALDHGLPLQSIRAFADNAAIVTDSLNRLLLFMRSPDFAPEVVRFDRSVMNAFRKLTERLPLDLRDYYALLFADRRLEIPAEPLRDVRTRIAQLAASQPVALDATSLTEYRMEHPELGETRLTAAVPRRGLAREDAIVNLARLDAGQISFWQALSERPLQMDTFDLLGFLARARDLVTEIETGGLTITGPEARVLAERLREQIVEVARELEMRGVLDAKPIEEEFERRTRGLYRKLSRMLDRVREQIPLPGEGRVAFELERKPVEEPDERALKARLGLLSTSLVQILHDVERIARRDFGVSEPPQVNVTYPRMTQIGTGSVPSYDVQVFIQVPEGSLRLAQAYATEIARRIRRGEFAGAFDDVYALTIWASEGTSGSAYFLLETTGDPKALAPAQTRIQSATQSHFPLPVDAGGTIYLTARLPGDQYMALGHLMESASIAMGWVLHIEDASGGWMELVSAGGEPVPYEKRRGFKKTIKDPSGIEWTIEAYHRLLQAPEGSYIVTYNGKPVILDHSTVLGYSWDIPNTVIIRGTGPQVPGAITFADSIPHDALIRLWKELNEFLSEYVRQAPAERRRHYVNGLLEFDTGEVFFVPAELQEIRAIVEEEMAKEDSPLRQLNRAVRDVADEVFSVLQGITAEKITVPRRVGLLLGSRTKFGVNAPGLDLLRDELTPADIERLSLTRDIFISPLGFWENPVLQGALGLAERIVETTIHEMAHQVVRNEGAQHRELMADIYDAAGAKHRQWVARIASALSGRELTADDITRMEQEVAGETAGSPEGGAVPRPAYLAVRGEISRIFRKLREAVSEQEFVEVTGLWHEESGPVRPPVERDHPEVAQDSPDRRDALLRGLAAAAGGAAAADPGGSRGLSGEEVGVALRVISRFIVRHAIPSVEEARRIVTERLGPEYGALTPQAWNVAHALRTAMTIPVGEMPTPESVATALAQRGIVSYEAARAVAEQEFGSDIGKVFPAVYTKSIAERLQDLERAMRGETDPGRLLILQGEHMRLQQAWKEASQHEETREFARQIAQALRRAAQARPPEAAVRGVAGRPAGPQGASGATPAQPAGGGGAGEKVAVGGRKEGTPAAGHERPEGVRAGAGGEGEPSVRSVAGPAGGQPRSDTGTTAPRRGPGQSRRKTLAGIDPNSERVASPPRTGSPTAKELGRDPEKIVEGTHGLTDRQAAKGREAAQRLAGQHPTETLSASVPERIRLESVPWPRNLQPVYSAEEWKALLERTGIGAETPIPVYKINEAIAQKLIYEGQEEVANVALTGLLTRRASLLALSTGTGKTYISSALIAELRHRGVRGPVLVLTANRSVVGKFIDVLSVFGLKAKNLGADTSPETIGDGIWVTTFSTAIRRDFSKLHFAAVVVDESGQARRWWDSRTGDAVRMLTAPTMSDYVLYLSATPFHTPIETGYLERLGMWRQSGLRRWMEEHFGVEFDDEGNLVAAPASPRATERLTALMRREGLAVAWERNLQGFHAMFGRYVLPQQAIAKMSDIHHAFDLARGYFDSIGARNKSLSATATEAIYLKGYLERVKLDKALEIADKMLERGFQVIIATEYRSERVDPYRFLTSEVEVGERLYPSADQHFRGAISALLPPLVDVPATVIAKYGRENVADYTGDASAEREAERLLFQAGQKRIMITTFAAGAIGVDMHDTSGERPRAVIYAGLPWSGIQLEQALGRVWRFGTRSNVVALFIVGDTEAEANLLGKKLLPRLQGTKAAIAGIRRDDPVLAGMVRSLEGMDPSYLDIVETDVDPREFMRAGAGKFVTDIDQLPLPSAEMFKHQGIAVRLRTPPQPLAGPGEEKPPEPPPPLKAAHELELLRVEEDDPYERTFELINQILQAAGIPARLGNALLDPPSYSLEWDKARDIYQMFTGRRAHKDDRVPPPGSPREEPPEEFFGSTVAARIQYGQPLAGAGWAVEPPAGPPGPPPPRGPQPGPPGPPPPPPRGPQPGAAGAGGGMPELPGGEGRPGGEPEREPVGISPGVSTIRTYLGTASKTLLLHPHFKKPVNDLINAWDSMILWKRRVLEEFNDILRGDGPLGKLRTLSYRKLWTIHNLIEDPERREWIGKKDPETGVLVTEDLVQRAERWIALMRKIRDQIPDEQFRFTIGRIRDYVPLIERVRKFDSDLAEGIWESIAWFIGRPIRAVRDVFRRRPIQYEVGRNWYGEYPEPFSRFLLERNYAVRVIEHDLRLLARMYVESMGPVIFLTKPLRELDVAIHTYRADPGDIYLNLAQFYRANLARYTNYMRMTTAMDRLGDALSNMLGSSILMFRKTVQLYWLGRIFTVSFPNLPFRYWLHGVLTTLLHPVESVRAAVDAGVVPMALVPWGLKRWPERLKFLGYFLAVAPALDASVTFQALTRMYEERLGLDHGRAVRQAIRDTKDLTLQTDPVRPVRLTEEHWAGRALWMWWQHPLKWWESFINLAIAARRGHPVGLLKLMVVFAVFGAALQQWHMLGMANWMTAPGGPLFRELMNAVNDAVHGKIERALVRGIRLLLPYGIHIPLPKTERRTGRGAYGTPLWGEGVGSSRQRRSASYGTPLE